MTDAARPKPNLWPIAAALLGVAGFLTYFMVFARFEWLRDNNVKLHDVGFVPDYEAKKVEQEPGKALTVDMPDGSFIKLQALDESIHDPTSITAARRILEKDRLDKGHVYTGLIYYDPSSQPLDATINLGDKPLTQLDEDELRPSRATFDGILASYK